MLYEQVYVCKEKHDPYKKETNMQGIMVWGMISPNGILNIKVINNKVKELARDATNICVR